MEIPTTEPFQVEAPCRSCGSFMVTRSQATKELEFAGLDDAGNAFSHIIWHARRCTCGQVRIDRSYEDRTRHKRGKDAQAPACGGDEGTPPALESVSQPAAGSVPVNAPPMIGSRLSWPDDAFPKSRKKRIKKGR